ncbi:membrane protein [Gordoniibacillus kamchatkensis]|uniref:Membrane protein n=1 Tax=Gordoniibacillus kamchatkensis TaxID=1590651 RepID=A0ABR5ALZ5_9BACL|nr:membrane protein [Paenibacillus sp. VKM B-2647]
MRQRNGLFLLWGFFLWLMATVIFHFFGAWLIDAEKQMKTAITFIISAPVIYVCTVPLYGMFNIVPSERFRSAAFLALPGMLLDILSLAFHNFAFPAISDESTTLLAAWLLWAYSLILLTAMFKR